MPTYDYECRYCGHSFETFQSMSDDPLTLCPECGKEQLRRLISGGTGVIFKGSGFYVNDSRSKSSTSTSTTQGTAKSPGDKKHGDTVGTASEKSGSVKTESKKTGSSGEGSPVNSSKASA